MTMYAAVGLWILALPAGAGPVDPPGRQSVSEIVRQIETEYCVLPTDFYFEWDHQRRADALRRLGQAGREALLLIARSSSPVRNCAVSYLVDLRDSRALPILRRLAMRGEAGVSLWGLGVLNDRESLPLIMSFLRDPEGRDVDYAITALALIDDDRARARLRELLDDPRYTRQKYAVVRALGKQRDATTIDAIAALIEHAVVPRDYLLVLDAVTALVMIRTPESLAAARRQWKGIGDSDLRSRALSSAREALRQERNRAERPAEQQAIQSVLTELATWRQPGTWEVTLQGPNKDRVVVTLNASYELRGVRRIA